MKVYGDAAQNTLLCLAPHEEKAEVLAKFNFPEDREDNRADHRATRFESHDGFDFMALDIPCLPNLLDKPTHIELYFTGGKLAIFCPPGFEAAALLEQEYQRHEVEPPTPAHCLYLFFFHLIAAYPAFLETLEDEISQLEDDTMSDPPHGSSARISGVRKRLLALKRYFDSLYDLLEDFEENQNEFLTKDELRYFHMHTNRADRLTRAVANLRDYITQVHEAYQNQLDINLNKTMKFFTVISTICLPLSLVAAWYGMNFNMPEYQSEWAYPFLIVLCLVVGVVTVAYFKKRKWF